MLNHFGLLPNQRDRGAMHGQVRGAKEGHPPDTTISSRPYKTAIKVGSACIAPRVGVERDLGEEGRVTMTAE